jgi:hypothetical protein
MKTHASIIAIAALLFLCTLIFGLSLSKNLKQSDPRFSGRPLAGALPAVHKLAALATLITLALIIRNLHRSMDCGGVEWTVVITTGFLFLLMFVTGTLLSLGKAATEVVQVAHKVGAF